MGYFAGMLGGLIASVIVPFVARIWLPDITDIYLFPVILVISFLSSWLGTYMAKPEKMDILMNFYRQTRPWGFWKPVEALVSSQDPDFRPNTDFRRDAFNVLIGIIWQMSMVVLPLYWLSGNNTQALLALVVLVGTSILLKIFWYDHLKNVDDEYLNTIHHD